MSSENILNIKPGSSVYLGTLPRTRLHKHAAVVLLIGLSGPIRIEFEGGGALDCRSALLDAGVNHVLDPCNQRIATVFFDLNQSLSQWLRFAYFQSSPYAFDLIEPAVYRQAKERRLMQRDWESIFSSPVNLHGPGRLDARIQDCVHRLHLPEHFSDPQTDFAQHACLSASRLNHLFKENTGVSFRHYKLWSQLLYFMKALSSSKSLLEAAHDSGFYDSAHLSNSYQKMLGISPSSILRNLDRFEV